MSVFSLSASSLCLLGSARLPRVGLGLPPPLPVSGWPVFQSPQFALTHSGILQVLFLLESVFSPSALADESYVLLSSIDGADEVYRAPFLSAIFCPSLCKAF